MAEVFTLDENGWRKLLAEFRQQKNEVANLRRHLQHMQGQRIVYMPRTVAAEFALADFRAHEAPDTDYPYPEPADATVDTIFPAYIQRDVTFDDGAGFDVDQDLSYDGADNDAEPVFVYSLRGTYIPPRLSTLENLRLCPIFKVNDKWFCDYKSIFRMSYYVNGSVASSTTQPLDGVGAFKFYEGVPNETYAPITVDNDGIITAHRACKALVGVSARLQVGTHTGTTFPIGGVIRKTVGSTLSGGYYIPDIRYVFPAEVDTQLYAADDGATHSARGLCEFAAGDNLQFEIANSANGNISAYEVTVTVEPIEEDSY